MNNESSRVTIWTRGFICIIISNVCANMAMFSVNTYVTTYMTHLGLGAALAGLVAGIYYTTGLLLRPVSGPMQVMLNKKKLMIATYLLAFFVNLGYAFFQSIGMFVVMRLIHGIQLAFYGSLALTIASNSLPEEKMASGLGIYGLSGIVSQTLGPSLGVWVRGIGESLGGAGGGFKAIFLMAAFFSFVSVIPAVLLPEQNMAGEGKGSFGKWYKNIIEKRSLIPASVIGLLALAAILYTTYMIPYGASKGIENVGIYFTVNAVMMVISRPIMGKLTDKYGPNRTFYPGIALYILSFWLISYATNTMGIIIGALCASVGYGTIHPAVQSMALQSVAHDRRAVASNTVFTLMDLGNFLGPTLAGTILEKTNYVTMFRMASVPLVLAVILFIIGWKPYCRYRKELE